MDLLTEPVAKQPLRAGGPTTAAEWLDLLSTGACDQETFQRGIGELLKRAPDAGWELLALIDQYYRRGKITAQVFGSVKSHLQDLLMGKAHSGEISAPLRRPPPEPAAIPRMQPPATSVATIPPPTTAVSRPAAAPPQRETFVAPLHVPERVPVIGDVLRGRYRIQATLGQGGMGTVFEATDLYRLDRSNGDQKVALKVLHTAVIQRPRLFAELRREFQHLQSLSHPNIVRVHEFDRDGDLAFFTMEYLSGLLLSRVLSAHVSAPVSRPYAWAIVRDVGSAVIHAHSRGVVHGDLNPGNIFITDGGDVRVLDFGAAHPLRRAPWISEFETSQQINVATPSYASCQLLEGETADARDDVYALACITYVLLTGNRPFREHSALKARTLRLKPERPEGITRGQWRALRAGLEYQRDRRPTDVPAWLAQFELHAAAPHLPALPTLLTTRPARRRNVALTVTLAIMGALVISWVWWATTHGDDVARFKTTVAAKLRATFADTVISQLWDGGERSRARATEPSDSPHDATPPGPARRETVPVVTMVAAAPTPAVSAPPAVASAGGATALANAAPALAASSIHARIELAADAVEVPSDDPMAHVMVKRSRTLRGDVTFRWWTESGTAKPGRDFTAVPSHVDHIPEGKNSGDLIIPLIADPGRHDPRSFYVVIDEPGENATLGQRTLTMVTLP